MPPETWERVIVVQWPGLLAAGPESERLAAEQLGHQTRGLAMEHLLHSEVPPGHDRP